MYAVIQTGGKQYKVAEGDRLDVDSSRATTSIQPVLLVDGASVLSTPSDLSGVSVSTRIVGHAKGPKIRGYTYKNKSNQRATGGTASITPRSRSP